MNGSTIKLSVLATYCDEKQKPRYLVIDLNFNVIDFRYIVYNEMKSWTNWKL